MIQISKMSSPTWFVHMFWNYKHAMPHYCNNNNNSSTILIFWSPKLLRSGSLEHKTSMDIEKIVVGESMLSIWLLLVQNSYQI